MSDGREERAEQEARRKWEQLDLERQAVERRERVREFVPASDIESDWEPERRDS